MRLHKNLCFATVDGLLLIFNEGHYADKVVQQLLKRDKRWGSRDRGFVAETTYDIVRWKRLYAEIAEVKEPFNRDEIWRMFAVWATLKGITNKADRNAIVDKALEVTNLSDVRDKHVAGYSGGMKQRFGIAQLLLNNPKLIIVDEPTAGLDPAERHRFLNVLREIGTNHIVIFSTHIVDDVKELCTDMAILNGGRILSQSTPKELVKSLFGNIWKISASREHIDALQEEYNVISSSFNDTNDLDVRVYSKTSPGEGFESVTATLEDVYFTTLNQNQPENVQ